MTIGVTVQKNNTVYVTVSNNATTSVAMQKTGTTNVVTAKQRQVSVSTNGTSGVIDSSTPVVLKNTPMLIPVGIGVQRLDQLEDVNALTEVEGATLVYDPDQGIYIVRLLDTEYITGGIHGGVF